MERTMGMNRRLINRSTASSILSCLGLSLLLILAYVGIWKWTDSNYYLFLVLGTYASLGGFALLQTFRATRMGRWVRRFGAIGVVLGFAVTIFLGLRPKIACLDFGPCQSGLTLHPLQFALGIGILTASLFLDVRNCTNLLGSE